MEKQAKTDNEWARVLIDATRYFDEIYGTNVANYDPITRTGQNDPKWYLHSSFSSMSGTSMVC